MMEFIFFNAAGTTLFARSDMESGHWVQEEMSVNAVFPYDPKKVIQRGQRIAFRDPATDVLQVFEIRSVSNYADGFYQQITAEHIAISELQDEHINKAEITDKTAAQALTSVLAGTLWAVGTDTSSGTQSADISRGSVWQAVNVVSQNWNVYITPRVVISSAGVITGRYLDIAPAGGTWNGLRLTIRKNLYDPIVTYNDEEVLTALYGYGGNVNETEITFKDEVWTATAEHPAKPADQIYLEWPEKTALYGRNGRARFGYYQNASITDPAVLLQKTWEALQRTCDPKISISGACKDLHRLGYNDEPLTLHAMALVEVEDTGESFYKEIIRLDVDLVDPTNNRPDIGDYIPNIVYINRDIGKRASGGGGGGGRGQTPNEAEESSTFAEFAKTNDMIGMVVGTTNGGYYIKAAEIVLSINQGHGTNIKLEADTIDINGVVSALAAQTITVYGLYVNNYAQFDNGIAVYSGVGEFAAGVQIFNGLACDGVNVTFGSYGVSWKSQNVVTSLTLASPITVQTVGGTQETIQGVNSRTTGTIYYLGR